MVMSGLPRALIKKYGVSKKAWAVFRGTRTRRTKVVSMARRRRRYGFSYGFKRTARRYGKRGENLLMNGLFGSKIPGGLIGKVVAGFVIGKYINPMLPQMLPSQDLIAPALVGGLPALAGKVGGDILLGSSSGSSGGMVYY